MQIVRRIAELRQIVGAWRASGERIALVPTMGALHAGHMALVDAARAKADRVVTTIFVNPLQFGAGEDLDRYPRPEEADCALLKTHGGDLLWLPETEEIYPPGFSTSVEVAGVSARWDGTARPGHFPGVATVVAKLLIAVMPDVALFGEKDFQQLAVIRRLVTDLGLRIMIDGVATVRDRDGLALSSRNAYLSADERERAPRLYEALAIARKAIEAGGDIAAALDQARKSLETVEFTIDYFALVDAATLEPIEALTGEARLLAAAKLGTTRLIDNLRVASCALGATVSAP